MVSEPVFLNCFNPILLYQPNLSLALSTKLDGLAYLLGRILLTFRIGSTTDRSVTLSLQI